MLGPAPPFQKSNSSVQFPPFPTLIGEHVLLLSKTIAGTSMVTNFRFCVCEQRSLINIPLMAIGELIVVEATHWLKIGCKDGASYCCTFATAEDCRVCTTLLRERMGPPKRQQDLFAFTFFANVSKKQGSEVSLTHAEQDQMALGKPVSETFAYTFGKEVERLGFDTNRRMIWRMSHANENYEYCPTYPKLHILPATVDDRRLKQSLDFRALKRFPSVVWRDRSSGVVLIRSSQPLSSFLGVSYYSNRDDVGLLEEIVNACNKEREVLSKENLPDPPGQQGDGPVEANGEANGAQGSLDPSGGEVPDHGASTATEDGPSGCKLAIVDCRSLAGVWGNSFKGGGTEDEAVYKCTIINLDLANIHTVRDSFNKLRALCHTYVEGTYHKTLSGSMWLVYISALLRGANIVVELMKVKKRPVLVHCSDGWDRTSQISSLSQLMMDPYYRTLEGFQVLVEREWLHFGHKFGERGGHDPYCTDPHQMSPIFLQFLDCVYQLTLQYPAEFEFNEPYLVKLVKHSQACLFGTFLHNCQREREACQVPTASVWSLLQPGDVRYNNLLYRPKVQVLTARFSEHEVVLWQSVYMEGHRVQSDFYLESLLPGEGSTKDGNPAAEGISRSRSMEDLSRVTSDSGRRNSDPSIGQESAAAAPATIHDMTSSSTEVIHHPEEPRVVPSDNSPVSPKRPTSSTSSPNGLAGDTSPNAAACDSSSLSPKAEAEGGDTQQQDTNRNSKTASDSPLANSQSLSDCSSPSNLSSHPSTEDVVNSSIRTEIEENGRKHPVTEIVAVVTNGETASKVETAVLEPSTETLSSADNGETASTGGSEVVETLTAASSSVVSGDACSDTVNAAASAICDGMSSIPETVNATSSAVCGETSPNPNGVAEEAIIESTPSVTINETKSKSTENGLVDKSSEMKPFQSSLLAERLALADTAGLSVHKARPDIPINGINKPSKHTDSGTTTETSAVRQAVSPTLSSSSSSSTLSQTSPMKKEDGTTPPTLLSRRARAASGASRDLSISPSPGNWTDTGRLRHPSNSESAARRLQCIRSSVSTSTSDISDSFVGMPPMVSVERGGSLKQHIDVDGLTLYSEPRQDLLSQLVAAKDRKIMELEQRLVRLNDVFKKAKGYLAGGQGKAPLGLDEVVDSDSEGGEPRSLGATSNPSLDSWEPLEETEAKVISWVPDHTVTHCAGCDGIFWMGRWKHHCRNCGKVFCDECTNFRAPVQHAHLNKPERVCGRCHASLLQLSPGASSDGRIPTLVADG